MGNPQAKKTGNWRKGVKGFISTTRGKTPPIALSLNPQLATPELERNENITPLQEAYLNMKDLQITTSVKLEDVLDVSELESLVAQGYIRRQIHPELPLAIYNYTAAAQYDRKWTDETLTCRGLVVRTDGEEEIIVARPWGKFFNHSEHTADVTDLPGLPTHEKVVVTDKVDGSMGIGVPHPDGEGMLISTRGSFTSDQAVHATKLLQEKYPDFTPQPGITYLWEIIYPENRITGWSGPIVDTHPHTSFQSALTAEPRTNAEGYVVHFTQSDMRVKIKQDDYVALHRIVTNLNERTVWETLTTQGNVKTLLDAVPDEYYPWLHSTSERIIGEHTKIKTQANNSTERLLAVLQSKGVTKTSPTFRKEFAQLAKDEEHSGLIFATLDGRNIDDKIWTMVKPDATSPINNLNSE